VRRGAIFWGLILVIIGSILMLDNLGLFANIDLGSLIWPLILIFLGVWFLIGTAFRRPAQEEQVVIPLDGATRARVRMNHGAGRLRIKSDQIPGNLIEGDFSGGLDYRAKREGEYLDVHMRVPVQFFPFFWLPGSSLDWMLNLNPDIPLDLEIEAGANDSRINLSDLQVNNLRLKSGASSTEITFPSRAGLTRAKIESGAASVRIHIPEEVAARISARGGLSSVSVDRSRFPKSGDVFQSADFEVSENRVEIDIEMGVGSVTIN